MRAIRSPRWIHWVATGFGAGYVPAIPGTAGSFVGLGLVFLMHSRSLPVYLTALAGIFALGVYTAGRVERATGEKDNRRIVIDEIAGMLVTGFALPAGTGYWIGGFVLFRALDITKPFPAGWIERRIPGGWGIMLDDAVAGLYANLILQSIWLWVHPS